MLAKIGPGRNSNWRGRLVVDRDAGDVRRQQVGRELHPAPRARHRLGERPGQARLADAGHVLEQEVALGDEGDEGVADLVVLALDAPADVGGEAGEHLGEPGDLGVRQRRRHRRVAAGRGTGAVVAPEITRGAVGGGWSDTVLLVAQAWSSWSSAAVGWWWSVGAVGGSGRWCGRVASVGGAVGGRRRRRRSAVVVGGAVGRGSVVVVGRRRGRRVGDVDAVELPPSRPWCRRGRRTTTTTEMSQRPAAPARQRRPTTTRARSLRPPRRARRRSGPRGLADRPAGAVGVADRCA